MMLLLAMALAIQTGAAAPGGFAEAVLDGRASAVQALIARGANVNEPDDTGMTPLMTAAAQGHAAVARLLIAAGADVNATDRDAITALMRAAAANRTEAVALLLSSGADPNVRTRDGATALTAAAFGGYANVVKSLLERRADPAASDQQGRTPMMAAAMNGHTAVVEALLAKGASATAADAAGATALRYAAARGHADIVDRLSKAGGAWSDAELTLAAEGCHGDVVKLLLDKGGNVKAARDGRSLLLLAAAGGCVDTVRPLLEKGADVNAKDGAGKTALMVASLAGSRDLVQMLLDHGADPNTMDELERTALMFASLSRQDEVVALLEKKTSGGQTGPASLAVESPTLKADQPVPREYTADGRNMSPPLTWRNVPAGTRQLAVVCEDPDAGSPPPFVHWVIYKIPATAKGLPENIPFEPGAAMPSEIAGAIQGLSGFRRPIYRGPAPPPGKVHHYHFIVYAIDADLDLKPGLNRSELLTAIQGHVIGQGELVATYERK
jgi:Raf kinase inhibitor-like YbhB/YbcL family protein